MATPAADGMTPADAPPRPPGAPPRPPGAVETPGSTGAAVQLLARGPQDELFTGRPEITFFKATHQRHTPFATETFEDRVPCRFGRVALATIDRRGDVLQGLSLEIRVPDVTLADGSPVLVDGSPAVWTDRLALAMIRRVRVRVGDVLVHDAERLWEDVHDKLFAASAKGLATLAGGAATPVARVVTDPPKPLPVVWLPIRLMPGACFPAGAVPNAPKITVEIDVESLGGLLIPGVDADARFADPDIDVRVLSECVFLGSETEQHGLLDATTDLMYERVADMETRTYVTDSDGVDVPVDTWSVDLSELNHPVRYLAVVAYDEAFTRLFQYEPDPFAEVTLELFGQERFSPRDGAYFRLPQRYAASCATAASDGVHVYSFALDASTHAPSGQLNFGVLGTPRLRGRLSASASGKRLVVKVFAAYYEFARAGKGEVQPTYV